MRSLLPRIKKRVVTYGESPEAQLSAPEICASRRPGRPSRSGTPGEGRLGAVRLRLPGRHNVANALAAIAVGRELLIPFETIARALDAFTGVVRRFEMKGERAGVLVVDDYAHHPTEIRATLAAARQVYPERRLVALFQPHLFSRTRDFAGRFRHGARGGRRGRRDGRLSLARAARSRASRASWWPRRRAGPGTRTVIYIPEKTGVVDCLEQTLRPGDLLVTLGAGDVVKFGEEYLKRGRAIG